MTIDCCVWAEIAERFDNLEEENPIIAIKGVRVVQFQGQQQLTMDQDACFCFNLEHPRTAELRMWWDTFDQTLLRSINQGKQTDGVSKKLESGRLISEMNDVFQSDPQLLHTLSNAPGGGGYFNVSGYVTYIKNDDRILYLACPEENCRKKVIDNDGVVDTVGKYRCDHCNRSWDTCVPTYMLLAKISDFSDSVYVNFYR